jgi:hypothetical protein
MQVPIAKLVAQVKIDLYDLMSESHIEVLNKCSILDLGQTIDL